MRFKPARRNGLRVQIPPDALFLRIVQGTEYQATNREPQVRFLLWRLMSEWRNGRRGILKISFLRVRIPLPTLCRCIRKAQEPALEAGGEQLAGSNPASDTMPVYPKGTGACPRSRWRAACGFESRRRYYKKRGKRSLFFLCFQLCTANRFSM